MELVKFYQGILESLGLHVDDKGHVFMERVTGLDPFLIKNKALVLPTREILANPDWDRHVAFHPLSENIARKDSPVFKELQRLSILALNVNIYMIMSEMVNVCADKGRHKHLNPSQSRILSLFPDADEQSVKNWEKIVAKNSSEHAFVKLSTLRDKTLNGDSSKLRYPRVTSVRFPFMDECEPLLEGKHPNYILFGVKVRKKDAWGFGRLFDFIFSKENREKFFYDTGSRSLLAPSFHSLMTSVHKLLSSIETVNKLLKVEFPDLNWGSQLADLTCYRGLIPVLAENDGEVTEKAKREEQMTIQAPQTPAVVPTQPTMQPAPVVQPQPAVQPAPQRPPVSMMPQQSQNGYQPAGQQAVNTNNNAPAFKPFYQGGNTTAPVAQPTQPAQQPQQQMVQQPVYNQPQYGYQPNQPMVQPSNGYYPQQSMNPWQPVPQPQMGYGYQQPPQSGWGDLNQYQYGQMGYGYNQPLQPNRVQNRHTTLANVARPTNPVGYQGYYNQGQPYYR